MKIPMIMTAAMTGDLMISNGEQEETVMANSTHTVLGECMSAGRIYDKIGKKAKAKVVLVTDHGTICKLGKKSMIDVPKYLDEDDVLEFN